MPLPDQDEEALKECLMQLYGSKPIGRTVAQIHRASVKQQLQLTENDSHAALVALCADKLVIAEQPGGSLAKSYRITAEGVRVYRERFAA